VDVRTWSRNPEPEPQQSAAEAKALARLEELPRSDKPGRRLMPFPIGNDDTYRGIAHDQMHRLIEAAPVQQVPIAKLVSNGQRSVDRRRVAHFIRNPDDEGVHHGKAETDRPIVVRRGDAQVLFDGHHRLTASYLRGETHVAARVVDLDAA
jgi:ParB-like nuclease domain